MGELRPLTFSVNIERFALLRIYTKEFESGYYKGTCTPMFTAALFTIAKPWKQPRSPLLMNGLRKV
jgi:hypothetical protein